MPLVHGIGDEVLITAVLAVTPFLLFRRKSVQVLKAASSLLLQIPCGLFESVRRPVLLLYSTAVDRRHLPDSTSMPGVNAPPHDVCVVCHEEFRLPCQANCGHWFCGDCILKVWEHGSALAGCRCPICRRSITLLLPFQAAAAAGGGNYRGDMQEDQRAQILHDVAKYNRLFSGGPVSVWQRICDMPLLLRRLARELMDPRQALRLLLNAQITLCVIATLGYVISPFDFFPEGVMGILGLVDDAMLVVFVAYHISIFYRALLVARNS